MDKFLIFEMWNTELIALRKFQNFNFTFQSNLQNFPSKIFWHWQWNDTKNRREWIKSKAVCLLDWIFMTEDVVISHTSFRFALVSSSCRQNNCFCVQCGVVRCMGSATFLWPHSRQALITLRLSIQEYSASPQDSFNLFCRISGSSFRLRTIWWAHGCTYFAP